MNSRLVDAGARARDWLFDSALPLWLEGEGFDPASGLFAEQLGEDGRSLPLDRRLRVQARQTYVCAEAALLGWTGDWRTPLEAGVALLTGVGRRRDGGFVHLFGNEGGVKDGRSDLYDHAFALFALAKAARALDRPSLVEAAVEGWDWLDDKWAHPAGGYGEGEIVTPDVRRQNPHMHLFEAAIALHEADRDAGGLARATGLATLFRTTFFDTAAGALPEYFNHDWSPLSGDLGRVTEPGHQFEWAWLLRRYAALSGESLVLDIADRLVAHGRRHGVDPERGVAVNEVWIEGKVKSNDARLWPQTERLKAAVSGLDADPEGATAEAEESLDGLFAYLDQPVTGAWRDVMRPDGTLVHAAAPASSLYHIACGVGELVRAADLRAPG